MANAWTRRHFRCWIVLQRFDEQVLGESFAVRYPHNMVIAG